MKKIFVSLLPIGLFALMANIPVIITYAADDPYGVLPEPPPDSACPSLPVMPEWPTPNLLEFKDDNLTVVVNTADSLHPPSDARDALPTNLCQTVYEDVRSRRVDGTEGPRIPNSLPSTPENPYNLHPDPVVEVGINPLSPTDDLRTVIYLLRQSFDEGTSLVEAVQFGLDILEGNPLEREYSGMPLLHYNGPEKVVYVTPEFNDPNDPARVTGGNAVVRQVYFDQRIMSDAALIVPTAVLDVPWTITYEISALNRGREDFSPFGMFFNGPVMGEDGMIIPDVEKKPGFGIDQTFFPVEDGTRTTFKIAMPPARQYKLTYHWGWRKHPPRIQALENGLGKELGVNLIDWERCVFGSGPMASEADKLAAIAMIGDLAPAKRMWRMLRQLKFDPGAFDAAMIDKIEQAFFDWQDRTRLPAGVARDGNFDITLFYVNNTLYGDARGYVDQSQRVLHNFNRRGDMTRIKVLNGDYFERAHMIVDFGGLRGWENTFQNTIPEFGAGPWFTFGRAYWWPTLGAPNGGPQPVAAAIPPEGTNARTIEQCQAEFGGKLAAASNQTAIGTEGAGSDAFGRGRSSAYNLSMTPDAVQEKIAQSMLRKKSQTQAEQSADTEELLTSVSEASAEAVHPVPTRETMEAAGANGLGLRQFEIHWNHEPSKRLRIYQFDQLHHDVAIWSIH
ncbi:hypothetical protein SAMN05421690_103410 [Nitrosomonas sp. Nm51]|uniref:hypothetical protein n=1 Tax=Nitrosomonas sp. Nm51 TaxID=133720 RepID=UPI0008C9455A|nr:hypothetical protein [Nitrosomonas sp. Nm51]SER52215.1 hypothetical protein SAMN05421690_103410 [Nitrosomonas sp. Nm51]